MTGVGAGQLDLLGNRRPVRRVHDHFVAGLEERHGRVEQRLLGAGGDDDFVRPVGDAVVVLVARADRLAQLQDARRRGVVREVGVERRVRRRLDVLGRREVRLARAEVDDVDALTAQSVGFRRDAQRR